MNTRKLITCAGVLCLPFLSANANTTAPFYISAHELGNPLNSAFVTAESVPDVISAFIQHQGHFSGLSGLQSAASLNYLGVDDALMITYDAATYTATVTSSVTGLNHTFIGTSVADLDHQLEHFVKSEGANEWAAILKEINKRSAASISDGNPNAATAILANSTFNAAMDSIEDLFRQIGDQQDADRTSSDIGFGLNGGRFKVKLPDGREVEGSNTNLEIPYKKRFNDTVSLSMVVPLGWTSLDGAKAYHIGLNLGLPLDVVKMASDKRLSWKLTPIGGVLLRGSADYASGAALYHVGLASSLTYKVGETTFISYGTQISHYESFEVKFDNVKVDPNISQQILKNGLRLTHFFGTNNRWVAQGMYVNTIFLEDAAVDTYHTLGAGLSYRFSKKITVGLHGNYDFGNNYDLWNIGIGSVWKF